jgi:hypothetical protein
MPTPTPRPDGATVHIVGDGDTLFGIALTYGVDVEQIRELNASSLGGNDMIWPGQELVISMPSQAPAPTALPEPPTPAPDSSSEAENPAPEGQTAQTSEGSAPESSPGEAAPAGGASVCVLAFHDRNGDSFQDPETEELLPNAEFALADASGVVDRYTSDGISEPHCFAGLVPGAYRVIQTSPPGYEPSGPAEWPVAVAEGSSLSIQFGNVRGEGSVIPEEESAEAAAHEEGTAGNSSSGSGSGVSNLFATVAKVSGVLVLLLAGGVAVIFVLNRRRV